MSLATRCTTCGTVFRVVQDQLKISEGWVRCGRCNEVFNALEGLFDLERDAPPEWQGAQPTPAAAGGPGEVDLPLPVSSDDPDAAPSDPSLVDRIDAEVFGARPPPPPAAPKKRTPAKTVQLQPPGSHLDLEPPDPHEPLRYEPELPHRGGRDLPDIDLSRVETLEVEPEFIRRAEDIARWRRSPRRFMLGVVALLLGLGLAAQWAIHFRDFVAARWPDTAPTLARVCAAIGCSVQPLQRIDAITVESSALARAGASPDAFRLSVTLRNRESMTLAMPSIDLTLTDGSGVLVARKALSPQDFRVAAPVLTPQGEQSMQLVLSAGNPRVAGYTVEIFYPENHLDMSALICGSLAFDTITNFPGRFAQQILPDQVHILNVSFLVPTLRREWGGCAGNIAYTHRMLGGDPVILAALGSDGGEYLARFAELGIDTTSILVEADHHTAQCHIITDQDNNQITAFHPGAMSIAHHAAVPARADLKIGIIAPDGREAMGTHAQQMHAAGIPFIFDPGQQLPQFDGAEHREILAMARWVAVNDYEGRMLCERTGESLATISKRENVDGVVVTLADQGCDVWQRGRSVRVDGVPAAEIVDPTGCGDAFRAGLLYALERGWPLPRAAALGNRLGAIKIASRGGQNHRFDTAALLASV